MVAFGIVWLAVPFQNNALRGAPLDASTLLAIILVFGCVGLFRMVAKIPADTSEAKDVYAAQRRKIGKTFSAVFGAEIVLIGLAVNLLPAVGLEPLAIPVVAVIVGVHFIPLARLFKAGVYYLTATVSVIIGISSLIVKVDMVRQDVVGFGMGLLLWLTSFAVFVFARKDYAATALQLKGKSSEFRG